MCVCYTHMCMCYYLSMLRGEEECEMSYSNTLCLISLRISPSSDRDVNILARLAYMPSP